MIKLGENNFLLADIDGSEIPFSAAELQGELIYCFLSAGLRDSSCFAEDIALAVEYSLHEKYEFNGVVSTAELTAMVVETLENAGFFTVADWFKRRNGRQKELLYAVTEKDLREIAAQQGMLFASNAETDVFKRVARTFEYMEVKESPMSLIIEMLRFHYDREKSAEQVSKKSLKHIHKGDYLVELKEVADVFPEFLHSLSDAGVLKINNITVYHPSIRMFLDLRKYAEFCGLEGVLTEMMWSPHAAKIAQSMDSAIEAMLQGYAKKCGNRNLPVYLTVNSMTDFMEQYFAVSGGNSKKLAKTLLESLSSEMFYDLYRVRF